MDELFNEQSEYAFKAMQVPDVEGVFIAINRSNQPALIISSNDAGSPLKMKTDLLSLTLNSQGTVHIHERAIEIKKFHMLLCETTEKSTVETFLILVQAFISKFSTDGYTNSGLIQFFQTVERLFKVTAVPDMSRERQGLWGELFLLKWLGDLKRWVNYYHSDYAMKFDLSSKNQRIEVKTTVGERIHYFSHDQLFSDDKEIAIASLVLSKDDAGMSLRELINEVRKEIADEPELIIKLENAVRRAGMQVVSEIGPKFNYMDASRQLAWYWSNSVPRFNQAEPPGVSNTHYRVNLGTVEKLSVDEVKRWLDNW